jgi:hypothetical protein
MFIISISCLVLMDKSYSNFLLMLLTIPHKDKAFKASMHNTDIPMLQEKIREIFNLKRHLELITDSERRQFA